MPVISDDRATPLIRTLSRAAARMFAAVTLAYTLIATITVLSKSEDLLAWICIVSTVAFILSLPALLITKVRFRRRVRRADTALAERLGFFEHLKWDATRRLAGTEAFIGLILRGEFRRFDDHSLRNATVGYAIAYCASAALAAAMVGSLLVIISLALSLLPRT